MKDDSKTVDENTDDYESRLDQELQEGSLFDNPLKLFKFLEGLNIKVSFSSVHLFLSIAEWLDLIEFNLNWLVILTDEWSD